MNTARERLAVLGLHVEGSSWYQYSPEVAEAISTGSPIVALESTIISHGMPYPQNYHTAREVEAIVRAHGAVPATICVIRGVVRIGLTDDELHTLSKKTDDFHVKKLSRRDLAHAMALGLTGATTVAATMLLAHRAGIAVFVTGGIGGVHRGVEETMDISADLTELGRTPVTVVCAGVKSILDIPRTLEYLETQGVCVASYQTDEFPAFFTPTSGCKAPCRFDSPREVADAMKAAQDQLCIEGGMVIGVPIPERESRSSGVVIENAIQKALSEATAYKGSAVTPFLLERVRQLTGGASLQSNIALIKNNAKIGAQIAAEYAATRRHQ